jgi:hypothetical protein
MLKEPEDDLRKTNTCRSFDGLYMKTHMILTFVGIGELFINART